MQKIGPDAFRIETAVKAIAADMVGKPCSEQVKALLSKLKRQGIDTSHWNPKLPSTRWKVWSDERLALLKDLLEQGRPEAEIAEAVSLLERQIVYGKRILRQRGLLDKPETG